MKVKIAVVQFESKKNSPAENLAKAEKFIARASKLKADIIVFPEDFITGTISINPKFIDLEGKYKDYFQKLAKKYHIDIVPGSIIEGDKSGTYNTAYYINSSGRILSSYKKINLWHPEREHVNFGNYLPVFNTKHGKVGLIICWDLIFPEIFRKMAKQGVEIVICPSFWSYGDAGIGVKYDKNSEIKLVDSLCVSRAFENEIALVFCNAAGKLNIGEEKDVFLGHSQITLPFIGAVKKLEHNREEMFIQEINTDILKDAEKVYGIKDDLKSRFMY